MDINKSIELLQDVRQHIKDLEYFRDSMQLDKLLVRLNMLIKRTFNVNNIYTNKLKEISFTTANFSSTMQWLSRVKAFISGKDEVVNLIDMMIYELELSFIENKEKLVKVDNEKHNTNNNIFLVHGHNEEMKQSVARTVEKLNLNPIILHEQPNNGRTIIEKFTDHSDVSFAIVLLSADDFGYTIKEKPKDKKLRARQNVIMELGFFLGKLGRQKVVALFEVKDNFEFPSDYQGVIFIPYDNNGQWKFQLFRELKVGNFDLDANKII